MYSSATTTTTQGGWGFDQTPSKPFKCQQCGKWWQTVRYGVSCLVYHSDGHCHYNDREVPKPEGVTPLTEVEWERF